jgi:hypothetical protein
LGDFRSGAFAVVRIKEMTVRIHARGLHETTLQEYAARFLLGGLMTVIAGLIAEKYGPATGGLFLAFPAIFPASATLVEKHERKRKQNFGLRVARRGTDAAGADAAGASIGSVGLMAFAAFLAATLPILWPVAALAAGFVIWCAVSVAGWLFWKRFG